MHIVILGGYHAAAMEDCVTAMCLFLSGLHINHVQFLTSWLFYTLATCMVPSRQVRRVLYRMPHAKLYLIGHQ